MHPLGPRYRLAPPSRAGDEAAWESLVRGLYHAYRAGEISPRAYTVLFFALAAQWRGWRLN